MDTQTTPAIVTDPRSVERLITGRATSDGAGVKLTRVLTQDLQRRLDPFLMLEPARPCRPTRGRHGGGTCAAPCPGTGTR